MNNFEYIIKKYAGDTKNTYKKELYRRMALIKSLKKERMLKFKFNNLIREINNLSSLKMHTNYELKKKRDGWDRYFTKTKNDF